MPPPIPSVERTIERWLSCVMVPSPWFIGENVGMVPIALGWAFALSSDVRDAFDVLRLDAQSSSSKHKDNEALANLVGAVRTMKIEHRVFFEHAYGYARAMRLEHLSGSHDAPALSAPSCPFCLGVLPMPEASA